ncbi:hypothetical protein [Paenibacillus sp. sgz302251]|uniref:hypothetical protein n=1 Tax=Paenibacillus sp. sgz302251 TaxID=3414493 RepID=UPI003C7C0066
MIRNERGYALLLVIFMILIFTILGVAIAGASLGGATRTETRENDVQSLHLAEKALNEAVSYLVSEFDGRDDISPDELAVYMNKLKDIQNFRDVLTTNTELSGASAHITDIKIEEGSIKHSYALTLTSEAAVNGVKRKLEQKVMIDSYPEFLQYSYGSEQDVIINGAVYTIGKMYAGRHLKIYNKAKYIYNSIALEEPTQFPRLDGDLYISSRHEISYCDYMTCNAAMPSSYQTLPANDESLLNRLLGIKYENIRDEKSSSNFVSINLNESFLDKAAEAAGNGAGTRDRLKQVFNENNLIPFIQALNSDFGVRRVSPREEPAFPDWENEEEVAAYEAALKNYRDNYLSIFNSQQSESIIFDGDLRLDGIAYKGLVYGNDLSGNDAKAAGKWFIVNGDLLIDNYSSEDLIIQANILVTGNVMITGKKIKVDSTIISLGAGSADGKTVVQDAEIKGLQVAGKTKQLVLMSRSDILLNRFEAFTNYGRYSGTNIENKRLDAFFYSEGEAELYGVGSTFWLNGGFFAKKNLTINAVLGSVEQKSDLSGIIFDKTLNEISGTKLDSRFIIEYNSNIFEDQYSGLPRVKQISVQIGSKQLQK